MALYKRKKTWWADFSVHGERYRQSLDTTDWREAQARQKELIAQANQGKLAPSSQQFARLAFAEAAERYVDSRRLELSESSLKKERQLLVQPSRYLQATPLTRITTESLLAYREWRIKGVVGASIINMEMGVIRRILKRAKRWHLVGADLKSLKEHKRVGRALANDEKLRLLKVAGSGPDWHVACCAAVLALNTTMRGCELKGLRWRDVNLLDHMLTVRRSKTDAGERVIPLNADALAAILELYRRVQPLGGTEADHYVFPACENGKIDPTRPQKSWRSAWRSLRKAAGLPRLRFHDLRHHAITELAESQASDQTIMAIAGHVSPKMLAHYSHVRIEAKRRALDALAGKSGERANKWRSQEGSYVTKNVTIELPEDLSNPEVIEKVVGAIGFEPTTSTVSR